MIRITLLVCGAFVSLIALASAFHINVHDWFPDEAGAKEHARVAKALSRDAKDAEAIVEYQTAVNLAPKNAAIRFDFAKALERAGQDLEAESEMSAAARLAPNDKKMQYEYAYFFDRVGNTEAAIKQYEPLLTALPADIELRKNILFFAARDYEILGEPKKAYDLYQAYLKLQTNLNGAWLGLARCQHSLNQKAEAIATLRRATVKLPNNSKLRYELGELLAQDNQKDAAIREIRRAVELNPDCAEDADDFIANITRGSGNVMALIPLRRTGNSYLVRVVLNRSVEANLVVDSGADVCMISHDLASKLNLNLNGAEQSVVSGIGGKAQVRKAVIDTMRIGSVTNHNVKVAIHDLPSREDGLLGMNVLRKYNFSIDPSRNLLQLSRRH